MELPNKLLSSSIEERKIYFFTNKSPIGIAGHMHVCIKAGGAVLLFSTCTSQTDTVYKLAVYRSWDPNTFPCFKRNSQNKFDKEFTYINCNNIVSCTEETFTRCLGDKTIVPLDGQLSEQDMQLIASGVCKSIVVPKEIKDLFRNL